MHHGLRLPVALALSSALLGSACAPKNPPALPVSEAKPIVVPMPAPPQDATLFGYLKLRDARQTVELFGGPMLTAGAAQQGLNLTELQQGRPAAVFAWDPQGADAPQAVPAVALLPMPAQGTLAARLKLLAATAELEPFPDGTMASMNPAVADRARAGREGLVQVLNAPLPFDGLLYLNAAAILNRYLPTLRGGLHAMEPLLTAAAAQRKDAPSPKSIIGTLDGLFNSLEGLRAVAVGAKPYDGGIEISTLVQAQPWQAGGPVPAPDLAQFLPLGDVRLVWNSRDIKRLVDFFMAIYGPMLDEKPGVRAQVMPLIDEWLKAGRRMDSAMSMSFGGERGFRGHGLMRVDNAAAAFALVGKSVQLFQAGPVHDAYKSMGVDLQIVRQAKTRKLFGWPVDRYEYRLTMSAQMPDPAMAAVWNKLSNMTYEVAQIGPYVAYALNGSLDEIVKPLFVGKGPNPMKATAAFPPGGHFYVDCNVASLLAGFKSMLPPPTAERLPDLPPQTDPVLLFGYDSGETGYYKLRVPGPLLLAMRGAMR